MTAETLIDVIMPQFGESVDEAQIVRWIRSAGERVEEFEPLFEVNTDKIDVEVPSPATGTLSKIITPAGATVPAGTVVALIDQEEGVSQVLVPQNLKTSLMQNGIRPGKHVQLGFISPVVARMSTEMGVDLSQVKGTGMGGRITKDDVLAYAQSNKLVKVDTEEILPLSPLRRTIAERMAFSKQTIPHVTTVMEADLSRVVAHRKANKEAFAHKNVNLTLTAYFTAATVQALLKYPVVNASWSDQGIILHHAIHIGIAVSLGDEGLVVPVIRDGADKSLMDLATDIADLSFRARSGELTPKDVQGATFSITNHGVGGSLFAIPAINPPQCAILGVGAAQKRVVVIEDENGSDSISIRPMIYLSLTFDHRILDGALADKFLNSVVSALETWE